MKSNGDSSTPWPMPRLSLQSHYTERGDDQGQIGCSLSFISLVEGIHARFLTFLSGTAAAAGDAGVAPTELGIFLAQWLLRERRVQGLGVPHVRNSPPRD